jgi:hypothetical protein
MAVFLIVGDLLLMAIHVTGLSVYGASVNLTSSSLMAVLLLAADETTRMRPSSLPM